MVLTRVILDTSKVTRILAYIYIYNKHNSLINLIWRVGKTKEQTMIICFLASVIDLKLVAFVEMGKIEGEIWK